MIKSYTKIRIEADSERYVLACLMNWPETYFEVCDLLHIDMFTEWSTVSHRLIFEAIEQINATDEKPTRIKIGDWLVKNGHEGRFSPSIAHHLSEMQKQAQNARTLKQNAKQVIDTYSQDVIEQGTKEIGERATAGEDPKELARELEEVAYLALGQSEKNTITDSRGLIVAADEILRERLNNKINGISPRVPSAMV